MSMVWLRQCELRVSPGQLVRRTWWGILLSNDGREFEPADTAILRRRSGLLRVVPHGPNLGSLPGAAVTALERAGFAVDDERSVWQIEHARLWQLERALVLFGAAMTGAGLFWAASTESGWGLGLGLAGVIAYRSAVLPSLLTPRVRPA
jgi:hypothetical protein